jgi:aerobic-type carbon monoxide dehydrogenase small subunit (CoxS/CutS family)
MLRLNVNGKAVETDVDPQTPLLWVLRDTLGMTGTKYGCGMALCGACTVHLNGQPVRSCTTLVGDVGEQPITTIEGLSADRSHPAQKAWIDKQVPQCGYCQPGMIMACAGAMQAGHHGSEILSELKHVCICGTYQRIKDAVTGL